MPEGAEQGGEHSEQHERAHGGYDGDALSDLCAAADHSGRVDPDHADDKEANGKHESRHAKAAELTGWTASRHVSFACKRLCFHVLGASGIWGAGCIVLLGHPADLLCSAQYTPAGVCWARGKQGGKLSDAAKYM